MILKLTQKIAAFFLSPTKMESEGFYIYIAVSLVNSRKYPLDMSLQYRINEIRVKYF
jgi:hypothetical protein